MILIATAVSQISTKPGGVAAAASQISNWALTFKYCGEVTLAITTQSQDLLNPDEITNYGCTFNNQVMYLNPFYNTPALCVSCASG